MGLIEELKTTKKIKDEAIQEYLEYRAQRTFFEYDRKGIFHPIRAIVKTYTCGNSDLRTIINDARHVQNIVCLDQDLPLNDRSAHMWFARESSIIGYFSTAVRQNENEKEYMLGCSFCRPKDYLIYQKHIALTNAMRPRVILNDEKLTKICEKGTMSFVDLNVDVLACRKDHIEIYEYLNKEGVCVYYFPITLQEQFDEFIQRCGRYYKKEKKDEK